MSLETLKLDKTGGIVTITLNRADKLNALNQQTIKDLDTAFQEVYDDPEIKAVILTGAGDKAFAAGADISEFKELNYMNGRKFAEYGQEVFEKIEDCPKPVIAAIKGFALGGGCELAMACHMRIAAEEAKFGQPEVNLGIIPGYGGTQRLPLLIGKAKAIELILTGEMITAETAHRLGLVNYVVPKEEVILKAEEILNKILNKAGLAVSQTIECVNAFYREGDGYQTEANAFGNCCKTEDFKEGVAAFVEKRKPNFTGK